MRDPVLEILQEIREEVDYETETQLVTDGLLESFDIVSLVSELNDEFDIEIKAKDLVPENFNSLDAIVEMVERLTEE